eukprot:gene10275-18972_t
MAIKHGQLHYRSLEMLKTQSLQDYSSYDAIITLDEKSSQELMWWKQNVSTNNERFIKEIIAAHVPGVENIAADRLSRDFTDNIEWSLHNDVFSAICDTFGQPSLSRPTEPSPPTFPKDDLGGLQIIDKQLVQNEVSQRTIEVIKASWRENTQKNYESILKQWNIKFDESATYIYIFDELKAGIDTSLFSAHSVRGAAASKAVACNAPLDAILSAGDWSSAKTFNRHYFRSNSFFPNAQFHEYWPPASLTLNNSRLCCTDIATFTYLSGL